MHIGCVKCKERAQHIRGLCTRCYAQFQKSLKAKVVTEVELIARGELLPKRKNKLGIARWSGPKMSMQRLVQCFHESFGLTVGKTIALRDCELLASLIEEEAKETVDAIRRGDLVEAIDGMCDVLYVVFGAAITFGVDLEPFFDEVHRSNMLKLGGEIRADGKRLKPPGWKPPRIKEMLDALVVLPEVRTDLPN